MTTIRETMLIILPVVVGGIFHSWVIAKNSFTRLKIPLDGGVTWRGRRLLGYNKTVRGAVVMISATTMVAGLVYVFVPSAWTGSLEFFQELVPAAVFGFALGSGYILGELPNSFVKRQMGIEPGHRPTGTMGVVWSIIDQADSVIGVCLVLIFFYNLSFTLILSVFFSGILIHVLFDKILYLTRVKRQHV